MKLHSALRTHPPSAVLQNMNTIQASTFNHTFIASNNNTHTVYLQVSRQLKAAEDVSSNFSEPSVIPTVRFPDPDTL